MTSKQQRWTRRTFLHRAGLAAGVPLVAGAKSPLPRADDPDVLKVGLVGCGGRGTGAALQALRAEQGTVVLTAMADVFPERIEESLSLLSQALGEEGSQALQCDEDHRFTGFDACARLLESGVDVVLLAAPPHFRPEHLAAAVEAGAHVFCEKPVAVDGPGVRRVLAAVEAAAAKKLSIVSGFCWRYNVRHRELFARLQDGAIGALRAVYTTYNTGPLAQHPRREGWSDMEWQLRNWQHFLWLAGDHIVEQAVHSLDKMAWAFGDKPPLEAVAIGGRQARTGPESGNIYDHFSATFDYPLGVKGFHMCRQIAGCSNDNSDFLFGEKGVATIRAFGDLSIDGENPWRYEGEGNDMYQQEHDELFASIRAGKPIQDGIYMTRSTLLGIMAREAAYTGQTVTWEQALNGEERLGPQTYAFGECPVSAVPIPGRSRL
jgi:predicted dehydrogenase